MDAKFTATYKGICKGGPYDGAEWTHYAPIFSVATLDQLTFKMPIEQEPTQPVNIRYGSYELDANNVWNWKAPK